MPQRNMSLGIKRPNDKYKNVNTSVNFTDVIGVKVNFDKVAEFY